MSGSKIKSVTVVCQQGTNRYEVGKEYNGLSLWIINDRSLEFEDSYTSIFIGFTEENEKVFMTENAPVDVEYCKI